MIVARLFRSHSRSSASRSLGSLKTWWQRPARSEKPCIGLAEWPLARPTTARKRPGRRSRPPVRIRRPARIASAVGKIRSVFSSNREASMTSSWRMTSSPYRAMPPATGRLVRLCASCSWVGNDGSRRSRIGPPSISVSCWVSSPPTAKCHCSISSRSSAGMSGTIAFLLRENGTASYG